MSSPRHDDGGIWVGREQEEADQGRRPDDITSFFHGRRLRLPPAVRARWLPPRRPTPPASRPNMCSGTASPTGAISRRSKTLRGLFSGNFPDPPSNHDSFTNGPVAVQLLAKSLGLNADPSLWLTGFKDPAGLFDPGFSPERTTPSAERHRVDAEGRDSRNQPAGTGCGV